MRFPGADSVFSEQPIAIPPVDTQTRVVNSILLSLLYRYIDDVRKHEKKNDLQYLRRCGGGETTGGTAAPSFRRRPRDAAAFYSPPTVVHTHASRSITITTICVYQYYMSKNKIERGPKIFRVPRVFI